MVLISVMKTLLQIKTCSSKILATQNWAALSLPTIAVSPLLLSRFCSTSSTSDTQKKLMEFFDDEKNWSADEVKVGRAWTADDLRIKSNGDLHKLWYVLLKERNMLLTMEHACKEEVELFPSPERIDKVNESMKNLELVVRERNKAYFELETGESGERPTKQVYNPLGMPYLYRMSEHLIPKFMNRSWRENYQFGYGGRAVHKFLRRYREKENTAKRVKLWRDTKRVQQWLKRFPNVDLEAVKKHHPDVDLEKTLASSKSRGNHDYN